MLFVGNVLVHRGDWGGDGGVRVARWRTPASLARSATGAGAGAPGGRARRIRADRVRRAGAAWCRQRVVCSSRHRSYTGGLLVGMRRTPRLVGGVLALAVLELGLFAARSLDTFDSTTVGASAVRTRLTN